MQAEEMRLRPLIETTKQFSIPLFQRFYVWDKKYWKTLWDDLLDLILDADHERSHFLGSLVLIPADHLSASLPRFVVIDGQQRMVTLMLLLAAIRDHAILSGSEKLAEEIDHKMLFNPYKEGEGYYKLILSENDHEAFQRILNSKAALLGHRLSECYEFFLECFKQPNMPELKILFEAIADRLSLVTSTLATHENPYLVFESLNFKGHKLTEADLIRNYLFMRIPQKQQQSVYQKHWRPMEDDLGDHLTEFVRHYLSRSGALVKQTEVYTTLKSRMGDSNVLESIKELKVFSGYYAKLLDPSMEQSKSVSVSLKRLNRLEITTTYPFLLNCYHDFSQKNLTEGQFTTIINRLENYLIRRFVCARPTSELNKLFAPLYGQIQQQIPDDFVHAFEVILQNKGYPSDDRFRADLIEKRLYGRGDREKKTRFLLEAIEHHYKHKEPVKLEDLTIEHVMPQTLTNWWKAHLGEDWEEIHDNYLHTIGNLTLTGYNSALSNSPYPVKRQAFESSHLELNSHFAGSETWQVEDIRSRADKLVTHALSCWPRFGNSTTKQSYAVGVVGTKPEQLTVLDRIFNVKTWREVLERTLKTLADEAPEAFASLADQFPHYVSKSPQGFRSPRPLGGGYYFETNLGAQSIERLCLRAVEVVGYPPTEWEVKVSSKTDYPLV